MLSVHARGQRCSRGCMYCGSRAVGTQHPDAQGEGRPRCCALRSSRGRPCVAFVARAAMHERATSWLQLHAQGQASGIMQRLIGSFAIFACACTLAHYCTKVGTNLWGGRGCAMARHPCAFFRPPNVISQVVGEMVRRAGGGGVICIPGLTLRPWL